MRLKCVSKSHLHGQLSVCDDRRPPSWYTWSQRGTAWSRRYLIDPKIKRDLLWNMDALLVPC